MDGILRCSRYAFGPNRLHYCGPDANEEIAGYIQSGATDLGLTHLLKQFQTMFPYLRKIAEVNNIEDPFDDRVVEAYWIGNNLLETFSKKLLYDHLVDDHKLPKRIGKKSFKLVENALRAGAAPHHSFHVLDIWKRTGNLQIEHTPESMSECLVSWGTVISVDGPYINVKTPRLKYRDKKLFLGDPEPRKLVRRLESYYDIEQIKTDDLMTIHWGVPCEVISGQQAARLKKYTLQHITLANQAL